jgi:hypothetical protein
VDAGDVPVVATQVEGVEVAGGQAQGVVVGADVAHRHAGGGLRARAREVAVEVLEHADGAGAAVVLEQRVVGQRAPEGAGHGAARRLRGGPELGGLAAVPGRPSRVEVAAGLGGGWGSRRLLGGRGGGGVTGRVGGGAGGQPAGEDESPRRQDHRRASAGPGARAHAVHASPSSVRTQSLWCVRGRPARDCGGESAAVRRGGPTRAARSRCRWPWRRRRTWRPARWWRRVVRARAAPS